jgi:hypothetical protein
VGFSLATPTFSLHISFGFIHLIKNSVINIM